MNTLTRWFLTGALLICLSGCSAPAQAGQAVIRTGGSSAGAPVTAASGHGKTEVQIGSSGINVTSGSSHVRIGGAGIGIIGGSKSVVIVTHSHHPCPSGREVVEIGHDARLAASESACDVV